MVVQLGLRGERVGSWAGGQAGPARQIITERFAGQPSGAFSFLHLTVKASSLSLSSCGCLLFFISPSPPPPLSLLVQINTVPEPIEDWVLVGWVPPRGHGLWTHKSMMCPDIDVKTIR